MQLAFDTLKSRFTSMPILRHFDSSLPIQLYPDVLDFVISGILSQLYDDQRWYSIVYWLRKCVATKINYNIYHKELLAIVKCMKHWRHYLEELKKPVEVLSDHKNLSAFI